MSEHLLDVRDLSVSFVRGQAPALEAVNRVSLSVRPGEIVGIVGESGCGKSVFAQSLMRLLEHEQPVRYSGSVNFCGQDLLQLPIKTLRQYRGSQIAMIFQDPLASLNPVMTIGAQVVEAVRAHRKLSKKEARAEAQSLLERVGIHDAATRMNLYPGDFSGGMRQRVMIAMALAGHPRLLIADEPTTALDTTTQKQILDLLRDLNQSEHMAILLISHDLGVVSSICSRVHVMYLGQVVEELSSQQLLAHPAHPYSQGLIGSIPPLTGPRADTLPDISGQVPPLTNIPTGCRFAPRCPLATDKCHAQEPSLLPLSAPQAPTAPTNPAAGSDPTLHKVRCWLAHEEVTRA